MVIITYENIVQKDMNKLHIRKNLLLVFCPQALHSLIIWLGVLIFIRIHVITVILAIGIVINDVILVISRVIFRVGSPWLTWLVLPWPPARPIFVPVPGGHFFVVVVVGRLFAQGCVLKMKAQKLNYCIFANSLCGSYSFLNLEIVENSNSCCKFQFFLPNKLNFCCRNYSREETIQGQKLYGKIP